MLLERIDSGDPELHHRGGDRRIDLAQQSLQTRPGPRVCVAAHRAQSLAADCGEPGCHAFSDLVIACGSA